MLGGPHPVIVTVRDSEDYLRAISEGFTKLGVPFEGYLSEEV